MTTQSDQTAAPYGQTYAPAAPAPAATQPLSVWGFVLSFLFWPAGLVLSILAIRKVGREGGGGRGLAVAGVVISSCAAVFGVIVLLATMAGVAASSGV
jgi:hypothetical protein